MSNASAGGIPITFGRCRAPYRRPTKSRGWAGDQPEKEALKRNLLSHGRSPVIVRDGWGSFLLGLACFNLLVLPLWLSHAALSISAARYSKGLMTSIEAVKNLPNVLVRGGTRMTPNEGVAVMFYREEIKRAHQEEHSPRAEVFLTGSVLLCCLMMIHQTSPEERMDGSGGDMAMGRYGCG